MLGMIRYKYSMEKTSPLRLREEVKKLKKVVYSKDYRDTYQKDTTTSKELAMRKLAVIRHILRELL